jgi:hypothetical protein
MRKELFCEHSLETMEQAEAALDSSVIDYNNEREDQSLGDVSPIRRFEFVQPSLLGVIERHCHRAGARAVKKVAGRRVDSLQSRENRGIKISPALPSSARATTL